MKKFLIVVDTQYDFVMPNGALYVQTAEEIIVPGIEFLARLNPNDYEGVLFTADTHDRDTYYTLPESQLFPIHCVAGEFGWLNVFNEEFVGGAFLGEEKIHTYRLAKGVFSMWEEEDTVLLDCRMTEENSYQFLKRDQFFQDLKEKGVDTVQVFGVASDYCVKWAVDGLVERGFNVEVITDLCRGIGAPANDVFEGVPGYENVKLI